RLMLTPTNVAGAQVLMNQSITPNVTTVGQIGGVAGAGTAFLFANGIQTNNIELTNIVTGGAPVIQLSTLPGLNSGAATLTITLRSVADNTGAGADPQIRVIGAAIGDRLDLVHRTSNGQPHTLHNLLLT